VQEALTNAAKHAPGSRAEVSVAARDGRLVIDVTNEHAADRPRKAVEGSGTGLVSMRERAQAVGGVLRAGPSGHGWRVWAELPVHGIVSDGRRP
jgi:signal transduction histidine kinase